MKRPRRIIFNALTVLSLLLCVGMVRLWIRSYSNHDMGLYSVDAWTTNFTAFSADSAIGVISIRTAHYNNLDSVIRAHGSRGRWVFQTAPITWRERLYLRNQMVPFRRGWNSGQYGYGYELGIVQQHILALPHWVMIILMLGMPAIWGWKRVRQLRRPVNGSCLKCGYDLRATPDRCPECGAVPKKIPAEVPG